MFEAVDRGRRDQAHYGASGFELIEYSGVEGDKDAHFMVDIGNNASEE